MDLLSQYIYMSDVNFCRMNSLRSLFYLEEKINESNKSFRLDTQIKIAEIMIRISWCIGVMFNVLSLVYVSTTVNSQQLAVLLRNATRLFWNSTNLVSLFYLLNLLSFLWQAAGDSLSMISISILPHNSMSPILHPKLWKDILKVTRKRISGIY